EGQRDLLLTRLFANVQFRSANGYPRVGAERRSARTCSRRSVFQLHDPQITRRRICDSAIQDSSIELNECRGAHGITIPESNFSVRRGGPVRAGVLVSFFFGK